jgi:hypothetical protein
MISSQGIARSAHRWGAGAGLVGAAVVAALLGIAGAPAAHADADDPAVFDYSADPTNIFSPVYSIAPTGAENVISTDGSGDVIGTQDFTVSELGFPVDTFTGGVEYSPVSNLALDPFGSPYVEDISFTGAPGTVLPDNTGFLVEEFGGGWGNVLEEANITGTSPIIGDFLTTPFGTENITPIVDLLMNYTGTLPDAASAVDPSTFVDLLSSIGL